MKSQSGKPLYIIDGARTPFLKARKGLGPFGAGDLAVNAGRKLLSRQPFDLDLIDEVIVGSAMPSPDEANIGRVVALRLGLPNHVPAWTVMRNCASGMQSLDNAVQSLQLGRSDIVLAGGTDAMSHAPVLFNKRMVNWLSAFFQAKSLAQRGALVTKLRPSFLTPVIALLRGLTDPIVGLNMGQTAENLAFQFGITRDEMDTFAAKSHKALLAARDELSEIAPILDNKGNVYSFDDGVREDSTVEKLGKLRPFFDKPYGMVTAGNSSQITDGSAMLLLATGDAVEKHQLEPLARVVDTNWAGLNPSTMGLGPVYASVPMLQRQKLSLDDMDLVEINEAFAAQVLACQKAFNDKTFCQQELGLDAPFGELPAHKLNINGGAIACGHPIGASGARIVLTLANSLKQRSGKYGLASICIGGGQGGAFLIERV